jgi:hypothetical protein
MMTEAYRQAKLIRYSHRYHTCRRNRTVATSRFLYLVLSRDFYQRDVASMQGVVAKGENALSRHEPGLSSICSALLNSPQDPYLPRWRQLNQARQAAGLPSVKPCEVFDLIGGTSTGGYVM